MIALLERAESEEQKQGKGSGATDRLEIARLDRAQIRRDILDTNVRIETIRRETKEWIVLYSTPSARLWNWFVRLFGRNRQSE